MEIHGNLQVLKYRCEKRNIDLKIDKYIVGMDAPDFKDYDIVFAGGGADNEQSILSEDLVKYKEEIKQAVEEGTFFLLICGAYQLFGKYYKGVEGEIIPGLEIFDYYTEAQPDRNKRCIGNIITEVNINGEKTKVIGFENHGGQTFNVKNPFGKVLIGNGNKFESEEEGFFIKNVIATYLHGPLLSKNPKIADYIIAYCLNRKYKEEINKENNSNEDINGSSKGTNEDIFKLEPINDELEEKCRKQLLAECIK